MPYNIQNREFERLNNRDEKGLNAGDRHSYKKGYEDNCLFSSNTAMDF